MTFPVKDWHDRPDYTTPITAAALEDLEKRLSDYTDVAAATIPVGPPGGYAVLTEAPIYMLDPQYGLLGDNSDESVTLQAFFDGLPAEGCTVRTGPGRFRADTQLDLSGKRDLTIEGEGGLSAGAATRTQFALKRGLKCGASRSFVMKSMQVICTDAAWSGILIDAAGSADGETNNLELERIQLFGAEGSGVIGASTLLNLDVITNVVLRTVKLTQAEVGLLGPQGDDTFGGLNPHYANVLTAYDLICNSIAGMPARDPGTDWGFVNPTVQSRVNGQAGFVDYDAKTVVDGFGIWGGWMGDVSAGSGTWVALPGGGGAHFGGGLLLSSDDVANNTLGISVAHETAMDGLVVSGVNGDRLTNLVWAYGGGGAIGTNKRFVVLGNQYKNATGGFNVGPNGTPDQSLIEHWGGTGILGLGTTPLMANVNDGQFAEAPPNGTEAFETSSGKRCVRVGGVWLKSSAYT